MEFAKNVLGNDETQYAIKAVKAGTTHASARQQQGHNAKVSLIDQQPSADNHSDVASQTRTVLKEIGYKQALLSAVWSQSRLVASLLDQTGLAYHRVLDEDALALFLQFIQTELDVLLWQDDIQLVPLNRLNENLLAIYSHLIMSMDAIVLEAFKQQQAHKQNHSIVDRALGRHHQWQQCAKTRFEQVVCTVLEQSLPQAKINPACRSDKTERENHNLENNNLENNNLEKHNLDKQNNADKQKV
ncbi:hypothetical protein [Thalassotalea ganghwensis]